MIFPRIFHSIYLLNFLKAIDSMQGTLCTNLQIYALTHLTLLYAVTSLYNTRSDKLSFFYGSQTYTVG